MATVPSRVADRLSKGIKRFQPILNLSKSRDDGEADTVRIVTDMLAEVFGYDKYTDITAEYAIRGTYCDLATKIDGTLKCLIEVKAIGSELKDAHVKQAVDYAANQGVDWVLLTNAMSWRVYRVTFSKPIDQELVIDINFAAVDPKADGDIENLYLLCREGWAKSVLGDFHTQKQALSRFFLGAMVLSDPVLEVVRRELRRVSPDVKIQIEQIRTVLAAEVIKREVMEGEKADEARRKISRAVSKAQRAKSAKDEPEQPETQAVAAPAASSPAIVTPPTPPTPPTTA